MIGLSLGHQGQEFAHRGKGRESKKNGDPNFARQHREPNKGNHSPPALNAGHIGFEHGILRMGVLAGR